MGTDRMFSSVARGSLGSNLDFCSGFLVFSLLYYLPRWEREILHGSLGDEYGNSVKGRKAVQYKNRRKVCLLCFLSGFCGVLSSETE